jgi:hypothetical protein
VLLSDFVDGADRPSRLELVAVADAAGTRLRAETLEDRDGVHAATAALMKAVAEAIGAGYSLSAIARAEADGKDQVRRALRSEVLRRVERTGHQAREAEVEHHRAIGRAMLLGLSTREIATSAHVTHGTIRAITNRLAKTQTTSDVGASEPRAGEVENEPGGGVPATPE